MTVALLTKPSRAKNMPRAEQLLVEAQNLPSSQGAQSSRPILVIQSPRPYFFSLYDFGQEVFLSHHFVC